MMNFKYYKTNVLISIIAFVAIALFLAKDYWGISFSIISIIGLLLLIINNWLWKVKPFSYMFWVQDFSGRYEGELEYEFRGENCVIKKGILKHIKIIHQSGSNISVFSFTLTHEGKQSSSSESKGVYVEKMKDDKHYQLIYSYLNDGNGELGFSPHYGTEIIKVIQNGNKRILSGRYFTERLPFQTKGKFIELKKVSNNLSHVF